jgi:hypothetical protein
MDFVFDELANGRKVKTLTVVDDCTKESVQIIADTSIPALYVTRVSGTHDDHPKTDGPTELQAASGHALRALQLG